MDILLKLIFSKGDLEKQPKESVAEQCVTVRAKLNGTEVSSTDAVVSDGGQPVALSASILSDSLSSDSSVSGVGGKHSHKKAKKPPMKFLMYAQRLIDRISESRASSTLDNYRSATNSFKRFNEGDSLSVSDITPILMLKYQDWLTANGVCRDTVSAYMRSLRALYNQLPASKKAKCDPFADVFTGNTKTVKRALTAADIQHLDKLKLEKNQKLQFVRDMFLFCVYAMGMPFVDVAHLLKSQIHGEVIEYARQKTGKVIHVHIEGCMKEIMDRYNDPSSKFVFPILKGVQDISETTENHKLRRNGKTDLDIQYVAALKKYNRLLKVLGNMIGLNVPLTSYMARHTWTSEAYRNYVNIYVISQALGHSSPVTTQIYIKGICNDEVFAANKWLLQTIKKAPLHKRCHSKSLSFIISPQRYV